MELDEGYMYGLGAFETIAIENRNAILMDKHLERLNATLEFLEINKKMKFQDIEKELSKREITREAMKIMVSQSNTLFHFRENPYMEKNYEEGFKLAYSDILRNDTSPLTFHKTLNYGECIIEKRRKKQYNEIIFLNRRNEICEGTATNIFFVKGERIMTPKSSCGLLPGILRNFLLEHYDIEESIIMRDEIREYDECFVTNSLMGVMPVCSLDNFVFSLRSTAIRLKKEYMQYFNIR